MTASATWSARPTALRRTRRGSRTCARRRRSACEVRGEKYRARASILTGDARTQVFKKVKDRAANFAEYEKKAGSREIPVVELARL